MTKLFSRDSQHEFGRVLSTTTLMWFPFAVVFVYLPITIFYHNRIDFDYDAMVLAPFLLLGFLAFGIVFALSYFSTKWQQIATTPLFFIGVFLFLSDSLVPLQWGLMDGDEVLTESGRSIAVQLGLACAVIAAWWFLPKEPVQKFGVSLVALIVGWHLALLAHSTVASPSTATPAQGVLDRPTSHLPNIYHIVFDAYSALSFPASTESNKLAETLAGFTNFPNNLSNYVSTDASTPSFLTGKLFAGGSFKDFQNEARVGGLRQSLKEAGYRISVYAPNQSRFWAFENSDYVFTSQQINQEDGLLKLAQIVAVRAAPEALRDETLALFQSFLKDEYSFYKRLSVPLFEKLLQDERQRSKSSEYIYAHLILPHSPYVWDETCNMNASASNYDVQVLCATKLMKDLVQQLKNTDKYANSLIIFQSDHGFQGSANARSPLTPPPHIKRKIEDHQKYYKPESYFDRLHSLLLIKPPGMSAEPMKTSENITQLVDIPATVFDLIGIEAPPTDGISVFKLDEVLDREISIYSGVYDRNAEGRTQVLGRDFKESTIAHLRYGPGNRWRIEPDLPATHEGW